MIKNLANKLKTWQKNRIIQQHPLFRAAQITIHELLDGRDSLRSFFTDSTDIAIEIMVQEVLNDVIEIIESENPTLTSRKKLSADVGMMAMYQVLIILPESESKETLQSELHKIDGVSCELRNHIKEIYENVDYLKRAIDKTFVVTDDINGGYPEFCVNSG